jgi:hypothetical protein
MRQSRHEGSAVALPLPLLRMPRTADLVSFGGVFWATNFPDLGCVIYDSWAYQGDMSMMLSVASSPIQGVGPGHRSL